jgi:SH3-like domain-containing protein
MIIKKNRPTLELRATPSKDGTLICRVAPTTIKDILEIKGDWQYVQVKAADGIHVGWIKKEIAV